jgi:hypothetical protein
MLRNSIRTTAITQELLRIGSVKRSLYLRVGGNVQVYFDGTAYTAFLLYRHYLV